MDARPAEHRRFFLLYAGVLATAWGLLALSPRAEPIELSIAGGLQLFVGGLVWDWRPSAPSTARFVFGATALIASTALMRDASGAGSGLAALVLLPVVVAGVRASRFELAYAWALSAIALCLPEVIVGGRSYPLVALRSVTLLLVLALVIGVTVLTLVRELSSAHERQRRLTEAEREMTERQRHLAEETRGQLAIEDALRLVATLVASGAPAGELFAQVAERLAGIAGASMGTVVRFSSDLSVGEMVGGWHADRALVPGRRLDLLSGGTAAARVCQTGGPVTLRSYPTTEGIQDAHAAVGAPIYVRGRLWGSASAVFRAGETIPPGLQSRFERFAELVAMAIANADTVSRLVEEATTDALTNLANRRTFDQALSVELERASRQSGALAVALLDIDLFKSVNDRFGHQTGDRVLAGVAATLAAQARAGELVARLGGEEFVWLMPNTTAEEAVVATERTRQAVADVMFADVGHITLSAGVSSNLAADSERRLLRSADEALYAAKTGGRDQTVAAAASLSAAEDRVNPAAA